MKLRWFFKLGVVIFVFFMMYFQVDVFDSTQGLIEVEKEVGVELGLSESLFDDVEVVFCPLDDCYGMYESAFLSAKEDVKCAFYEFDLKNLSEVLVGRVNEGIDVFMVIDDSYLEEEGVQILLEDERVEVESDVGNSKYMHNKFCVIDSQVLVLGSANPTVNGFYKNDNNVVKLRSNYLAKNYENEFDQLFAQRFGYTKSSVLEYNEMVLEFGSENYLVSSYFCPQDNCPKRVINVLNSAKEEILFAQFSFTYDDYRDVLLEKVDEGVVVRGVLENRMRNVNGGEYKVFNKSFEVFLDSNSATMHHKIFVIDERVVITGSMNPSANAAKYNDENVFIVENVKFARLYKNEILRLMGE